MAFVDTVHCPDTAQYRVGLTCLKKSRNEPNNLTLCHEFAPGQRCSVDQRRQRFCIDRYEYPNKKGGHPPVMVSAYDAAGLCAEQGKRMCWESEWTAACEGPDKLPFPSGYQRNKEHCNIDNPYRHPNLDKVHSPDDAVRGPELLKLDQSVRSGSMESCKSGFGVYDLTGNFDEWVMTDRVRGKGKWAGLKGGAWGHVRNACRPITTSHVAHWSYYFISFRCCKDADPTQLPPLPDDGVKLWQPPARKPPQHPAGKPIDRGYTPG
jgi:formylglycine-generating enzyme required for sulfatase activity